MHKRALHRRPENEPDPASIPLEIQLAVTLTVLALAAGIFRERAALYAEILGRGHRLPYADQAFLALGVLFLLAVLLQAWFPQHLAPLYRLRKRLGWARWVIAALPTIFISWLFVYSEFSLRFEGFYTRLLFYLLAALLMIWLAASSDLRPLEWRFSLAGLLLFGAIFLLVQASQMVVDYPFILSWSEGNRYYDYSVLFGRRLYDYPADQPLKAFIDIGRQSLWGLPFLFFDIPIRVMRFWSQFLFTIPYLFLGWAFLRRREAGFSVAFFFGLWVMLFLNQGPIYTPLILAAILVALSRRAPLWLAVPVVLFAGYYARVARFTWLFAPAMWAVLVAFLENSDPPQPARQRWLRAILMGFAGILGGYFLLEIFPALKPSTGLSVSSGSIDLSSIGQMVGQQPMLWNRLWPNETFALGIVPGLLLAAGPLMILLIFALVRRHWKLDRWQILYLAGMNLAFLSVGLVISVKIGGGSNLHNLDMFLIGLVFTAGLFLESGGRLWVELPEKLPRWGQILLVMTIVYPAALNMFSVTPRAYPEEALIEKALGATQDWIDRSKSAGEILFLDQRQLLTFGYIRDVPLVTDYEKKLLMEMAMQNRSGYFDAFYRDLADHRFSLIISEPLYTGLQEEVDQFGSENNAWVNWVSIPLLCYYEPVRTYHEVTLQLLVPKEKSPPAPGLVCPEY